MCPLTTLIADALDILRRSPVTETLRKQASIRHRDSHASAAGRDECLKPGKNTGTRRYMCNAQSWATIAAPCPFRFRKSR